MLNRPNLANNLDAKTFRSFYYLKEELIEFCKKNGLPTTGSKLEITNRIAHFLDFGEVIYSPSKNKVKKEINIITEDAKIEPDFICSEKHRAYFKEKIGKNFSFNVAFQKWLKSNTGKTYKEAIDAYYQIIEDKKKTKSQIDEQFEYNAYIRDFFEDNKDKKLKQAIICWKYKKNKQGNNKYDKTDLIALTQID